MTVTVTEARAYAAGHAAALRQVAERIAELDILVGPTWRTDALETVEERRARERAEREAHAAEVETERNLAAGRHPGYRYRGGPIDYDTGLPAGSACAWLRRQRAQAAAVTHLRPAAVAAPALREEAA